MNMQMEGMLASSNELRKLILAHPDFPIAVCAGESANGGDFSWQYCTNLSCKVGHMLNINTPYDRDGYVYIDKDEFEDNVRDYLADHPKYTHLSDDGFDDMVKEEVAKYDHGWKDVIFIYADN